MKHKSEQKDVLPLNIFASKESIHIWAQDRSCAEASHTQDWSAKVTELSGLTIPEEIPVFFFNRIKVMEQGKGMGTRLMNALIAVADVENIAIVCTPMPYADSEMDAPTLMNFYRKYDFSRIHESGVMLRMPILKEGEAHWPRNLDTSAIPLARLIKETRDETNHNGT